MFLKKLARPAQCWGVEGSTPALGAAGMAEGCLQREGQRGGEILQLAGTELGELVHPGYLAHFQLLEAKLIWKLLLKSKQRPLDDCHMS